MDAYLRDRAEKLGATVINGLMMRMEQPGGLMESFLGCCAASYAVQPWLLCSLIPNHVGSVSRAGCELHSALSNMRLEDPRLDCCHPQPPAWFVPKAVPPDAVLHVVICTACSR
jgi:hypothetical protein